MDSLEEDSLLMLTSPSQGMATGNVVITCTLTKTLNAATSTNLLRRFQIDDELELLRLLDGQTHPQVSNLPEPISSKAASATESNG